MDKLRAVHVLFVCLHNAGRSQISEALFDRAAAAAIRRGPPGRPPPKRSTQRLSQ